MSAVELYEPIHLLLSAIEILLVSGASILCGKYMGRNHPEKAQNVFSLSCALAVIISGAFTLIVFCTGLFSLSGFLTNDPAVKPLLNQYLIGESFGILPLILGGVLTAFLSLENKMKEATISSIIYILVNVGFTYLFVIVFHMEALGLALASSIGLWVHCIFEVSHLKHGRFELRFSWKNIQWKEAGSLIRIGFPGAAGTGYQTIRGFIVNMLITQYVGTNGLSALAAANTLLGLAWAVPNGMLNVSRMMISVSVGEEDRQTLTDTVKNAVHRFIPLMCIISAIIILLAVPLTTLYYQVPSDPVFDMTVWGFRLLPICMPLAIFRMVFSCYGQAIGRHLMVNILEMLDGFVIVSLFSFLLVPFIGLNGVYIANIVNGITSILCIIGYSLLKNRRKPNDMEDILVIPPDFGVPESDRMDLSLKSMKEVLNISENIQQFCLNKGIDTRRSYYAALFFEEMAGNVVKHGFNKDKRSHSVDIRVVYKDDTVILRIKDNCIPFNPEERQKIFDPDDMTRNIGIRMVYSIAEDISYQNILGLNVLTIKI